VRERAVLLRSVTSAFVIAILAWGCSSSRHAGGTVEGETPEEQLKRIESDFRPSDLDPEAPVTDAGKRQLGPEQTPDSTGVAEANLEQEDGYRVQLYSTPSIDEAKGKKAEAEALFPGEWFYMDYDAPTYKIRAGNFKTRFDADRFARQLVEKGFPDSWAVPSRVYKNPGLRP